MMKSYSTLVVLLIIIIVSGCASRYRPINPPTINYSTKESQDGIDFSYKYDVLREKNNKKLAKKEVKKNVKVLAVKIINTTDSVIVIEKNVAFFSGQNRLHLMEPIMIKKTIKQSVPSYLPYLLLSFITLNYTEKQNGIVTKQQVYPVGLVIGPSIMAGNMAVAGTANKKFLGELLEYDIVGKEIRPGDTIYGIIGISGIGYNPISSQKVQANYDNGSE